MNTNRQQLPQQQQQLTAEQIQKQREYLKQQQKLRLMAASSSQKTVTADTLIENLLGKKDTFRPVDASASTFQTGNTAITTSVSAAQQSPFNPRLAANHQSTAEWISPTSVNFPALYRRVWGLVGQTDGMVDTRKIFPLLLTSGLHTDVLGYIWGLANQQVAGQLTELELYVLLALVALAQKGYSFNSASVLSLVPQPPVPNLNLGVEPEPTNMMQSEDLTIQSRPATSIVPPIVETNTFTPFMAVQPHLAKPPLLQTLHSQPVVEQNDFDDFTDFQSASSNIPDSLPKSDLTETNDMPFNLYEPKKETSKSAVLPEPVFVQKFPTVAVLGGGGRSVGSRLANHSLSASKTSKSRLHKHHHHNRNALPSHHTATEDDFSDFQQALSGDLFPKCLPTLKPPTGHTFLLKESAIRVESPEHVELNMSKPDLLGETLQKIPVVDENPQVSKPTSSNQKDSERGRELMGIEDRYGALRALSFVNETPAEVSDDFGDFFSTQSSIADDSFAEIASRDNNPDVGEVNSWSSTKTDTLPKTVEFEVDDWGSFASAAPPTYSDVNILTRLEVNNSSATSNQEPALFDALTNQIGLGLVDLNLDLNIHPTPLHSDKGGSLTKSIGSKALSFDLMDPTVSPDSAPLSSTSFSEHQFEEDDFGEFVGPDTLLEDEKVVNIQIEGNEWQEEKEVVNQCGAGLWLDETKSEHPWPEEESKYDRNRIFKGEMAENHLVSNLWLAESKGLDTQSVSSLELPGLDQVWDAVGEWRKCLQSCVTVLQCAVDKFEAVLEPAVLLEVLTSSKGQDYLRDVVEVWAVSERLAASYRQSAADPKIDALLNSAEAAWLLLKPYLSKAQIPLEPETLSDGQELCSVCLVGGAKLEFDSRTYHASCANLWLNLVDSVLPALHQP